MKRYDGRTNNQMRILKIEPNKFGYAPGSVFVEVGNTKVLCSVTIQAGVPAFLRGKKTGWLSCEYAMLPSATQVRTQRVSSNGRYNGRSIEISRLIGRSLRAVVDLDVLPDRTITIDCDVLQADGGTRTASISGAYIALIFAQKSWLRSGYIEKPFMRDTIAAISVGILNGECILDPSYKEDSLGQADFNFIIAQAGGIIEIQGGAETKPVPWDLFESARLCALEGANQWFDFFDKQNIHDVQIAANNNKVIHASSSKKVPGKSERVPLFSLQNRQKQD